MRTLKCLLVIGLCVVGAVLVATAFAQPAAPAANAPRVAVCNAAEVFANYERARDLNAEMERKAAALRQEGQRREDQIKKMQEEISQLNPGSKQHEDLLERIESARFDAQKWGQLEERRLRRWHAQRTKEMYTEITEAISKVAKDRGIEVVLFADNQPLMGEDIKVILEQMSTRSVLYASPRVDITTSVLTEVNQAYRRGNP